MTIAGIGWLTAFQIVSAITSQLATIALAALLTPLDFGLYGLAMIAVAIVAIPGDLGLSVELVRRSNFDTLFPTALRLRWAIAGLLSLTCVGIAWLFSILYAISTLFPLILALALIFPATALAFGPRVLLTRSLNFRAIAQADMFGRFLGPLAAVLLAVVGWGYWSLAFGLVFSAWITAIALAVAHPVRAAGKFDRGLARSLTSAGKFISLSTLFGFLLSTLDNLTTATFLGLVTLGFYAFSYSLAVTIPRSLSSMVETVTFPVFSKFPEDRERMWRGFDATLRYVAYFAFPLAFGYVCFAPTLIPAILGTKWVPIVPIVQILAAGGLAYALAVPPTAVLLAIGRAKAITQAYGVAFLVLTIGLIPALIDQSVILIAIAASVSAFAYLVMLFLQLGRWFATRSWDLCRATISPALSALVASFIALLLLALAPSVPLTVAIAALSGLGAYCVALQLLSRGEFLRAVKDLASSLGK